MDELRLSEVWAGEAVLLRASRGYAETDAPFSLRWLFGLVMQEKRSLREIGIASLALSILTIFPPFLVMTVVDKVLTHSSYSTLALIAVIVGVAIVYETLLGYARRLIVLVVGARIDARLNLHVFNRLLRLPLDYFERHPAGETMYNISQIHRVREFITGKLLTAFLDLMTLCVLLPFLFWLNAPLAWIVLACACVIAMIILVFLRPLAVLFGRVVRAETDKQAALGETVFGIRTVKSLALEPQRKALWDERIAEAGKWRLAYGKLGNWPQTLVTPIERFMWMGAILLGVYWALIGSDRRRRRRAVRVHDAVAAGRAAAGAAGAADGRIPGRGGGDRPGGLRAEPPAGGRCRVGRAAAALRRRDHLRGCDLHLWRHQDAGARSHHLLDPGRHDARHCRAVGLGQVHHHAPAAGHQPRLLRLPEDRRRPTCARSTCGTCGRASASCCRTTSCSAARSATTSSPAGRA